MSDYKEAYDSGYSVGFEGGYVNGRDDAIEHLEDVRAKWFARSKDVGPCILDAEGIYASFAEEIEEVIKQIKTVPVP